MDVRDIRLKRLEVLLREHGNNKAALARTLRKAPAQISQWFSGIRTITEDSAREIEREAKRPRGWLDSLDENAEEAYARDLVVNEALDTLGPDARRDALDYIRFKLERAHEVRLAEKLARYLVDPDDDPEDDERPKGDSR